MSEKTNCSYNYDLRDAADGLEIYHTEAGLPVYFYPPPGALKGAARAKARSRQRDHALGLIAVLNDRTPRAPYFVDFDAKQLLLGVRQRNKPWLAKRPLTDGASAPGSSNRQITEFVRLVWLLNGPERNPARFEFPGGSNPLFFSSDTEGPGKICVWRFSDGKRVGRVDRAVAWAAFLRGCNPVQASFFIAPVETPVVVHSESVAPHGLAGYGGTVVKRAPSPAPFTVGDIVSRQPVVAGPGSALPIGSLWLVHEFDSVTGRVKLFPVGKPGDWLSMVNYPAELFELHAKSGTGRWATALLRAGVPVRTKHWATHPNDYPGAHVRLGADGATADYICVGADGKPGITRWWSTLDFVENHWDDARPLVSEFEIYPGAVLPMPANTDGIDALTLAAASAKPVETPAPLPGTWAWACTLLRAGKLVRRAGWDRGRGVHYKYFAPGGGSPGFEACIRLWRGGSYDEATQARAEVEPGCGWVHARERAATNWEEYAPAPAVGSWLWAFAEMTAGRPVIRERTGDPYRLLDGVLQTRDIAGTNWLGSNHSVRADSRLAGETGWTLFVPPAPVPPPPATGSWVWALAHLRAGRTVWRKYNTTLYRLKPGSKTQLEYLTHPGGLWVDSSEAIDSKWFAGQTEWEQRDEMGPPAKLVLPTPCPVEPHRREFGMVYSDKPTGRICAVVKVGEVAPGWVDAAFVAGELTRDVVYQ